MKKIKLVDYELLFELMKNARRSDRTLAKVLHVSQPTVTRKRAHLEKELIDGYAAIPKWEKLGYCLFAITFIKIKAAIATKKKYESVRKTGLEWLISQPNIVMAGGCRGMGWDSFTLSFHKSYADYDDWMRNLKLEMGDFMENVDSVLVNLCGKELLKSLHLKYLAETK